MMNQRGGNMMQRVLLGFVGTITLLASAAALAADPPAKPPAQPIYRIEAEDFEAREADIRAVFDSVIHEMWPLFPDYKLDPIVVIRGHGGPITLFKRNEKGEIVVRLDTHSAYWSQYSYQFAHEFCHILCGFKPGYEGNKWFEETLCETASLFAMRGMARTWRTAPPFPNWHDYHDELRNYTDSILLRYGRGHEVVALGLPGYLRAHQPALRKTATDRELNGAMAFVFLQLFEEQPQRWEAVRWLNVQAAPPDESFLKYLQRWHDAAPPRHQPFIELCGDLFGLHGRLKPPAKPARR